MSRALRKVTTAVVLVAIASVVSVAAARVREVGQLQNAEASTFSGTIRVANMSDPYADALSLAPEGGR